MMRHDYLTTSLARSRLEEYFLFLRCSRIFYQQHRYPGSARAYVSTGVFDFCFPCSQFKYNRKYVSIHNHSEHTCLHPLSLSYMLIFIVLTSWISTSYHRECFCDREIAWTGRLRSTIHNALNVLLCARRAGINMRGGIHIFLVTRTNQNPYVAGAVRLVCSGPDCPVTGAGHRSFTRRLCPLKPIH